MEEGLRMLRVGIGVNEGSATSPYSNRGEQG